MAMKRKVSERGDGENEEGGWEEEEKGGEEEEGIQLQRNDNEEEEDREYAGDGIGKSCVHELVSPSGSVRLVPESETCHMKAIKNEDMAKTFPFKLDPFQLCSIFAIEKRENILVAAHTSAGKTVIAEYAIASVMRMNSSSNNPRDHNSKNKVIYTSPLKALSNQKFRELKETFHDVGLLTGDISICPEASCLVMTTEVLRSMLYKGSVITEQCSWIIFDEVHYLRDAERGVAWEEAIMLSPRHARMVFLSATIPNATEFAQWVAKTHGTACHVVTTEYRPTPLQHFVFPAGGDNVYMIVDEKGQFRQSNFRKAIAEMKGGSGGSGGRDRSMNNSKKNADNLKAGTTGFGSDIFKLIRLIMTRGFDPVIVFSFSKRDCESLSVQMMQIQLANEKEKKLIRAIFESAVDTLREADRKLPQITRILPLLLRGVGIHHGGMMPILKEVTELLFQEGLLKVLFATETFSTGLNMPARTVVMTGIRKFDGSSFRIASSGEYIQMSGRAGRRGLDERGIVILMLNENMEPEAARNMLRGKADSLNSAYHLTYHAMLNTMRAQSGFSPSTLVQASFKQFQAESAIPAARKKMEKLSNQINDFNIANEQQIADYLKIKRDLSALEEDLRSLVFRSKYVLKFMQPGRLVRVQPEELMSSIKSAKFGKSLQRKNENDDDDIYNNDYHFVTSDCPWGVVVNIQKLGEDLKKSTGVRYMVQVLAQCTRVNRKLLVSVNDTNVFEIIAIPLSKIVSISSIRVYLPGDLRAKDARKRGYDIVKEVSRRYPNGIPCLDIEEDIKVNDPDVRKLIRRIESTELRLKSHPFKSIDAMEQDEGLRQFEQKAAIVTEKNIVKQQIVEAGEVIMKGELRARHKVLRRLDYVNKEGIVQLKGHIAAEISSGDDVVLTELLMDGTFIKMKPDEVSAFLSCMIHEERARGNVAKQKPLRPELEKLHKIIRAAAKRVIEISAECHLDINHDEHIEKFRPDMMEVMYLWSKGATFGEVCKLTETYEGSIVRLIRRIEELLRQLVAAAQLLQDKTLITLFEDSVALIRRDVVFAPNLYL